MSEHPKDAGIPMAAQQEPLFWYRPVCDGEMYEGPIHNNSVGGRMMRDEKPGEWLPLYSSPHAVLDERAAFEADTLDLYPLAKFNRFPSSDCYNDSWIESQWGAWQRRAKFASTQPKTTLTGEINAARIYIAKLEQAVIERDAMLGKRPCQNSHCNELNAARALLREVIGPKAGDWYTLERRVEAYFDACDKPGAPDAS